jgi:hypothetical protein
MRTFLNISSSFDIELPPGRSPCFWGSIDEQRDFPHPENEFGREAAVLEDRLEFSTVV